ncbi:MAG: DUF72 domain-containing protein [Candidatus Hydrothermales bacterium]
MKIYIGLCSSPSKKNYFDFFNAVEIQQTFYTVPGEKKAKNLREKIKDLKDFYLFLKAPQHITHPCNSLTYRRSKKDYGKKENYGFFKNTIEVDLAWKDIRNFAEISGAKGIVFQTPSSFSETEENIKNIKNFFKDKNNLLFFWECRGKWKSETVREIYRDFKIYQALDPFHQEILTDDIMYLRLHGRKMYKYKFEDKDFEEIFNLIKKSKSYVFVMFNNIYMWEDALRFREFLVKKGVYE